MKVAFGIQTYLFEEPLQNWKKGSSLIVNDLRGPYRYALGATGARHFSTMQAKCLRNRKIRVGLIV